MNNRFGIVLFSVAAFATFFCLGRGDVFEDNEGQRAAPPATMLRTGDYIIPRLNGEPYLVKPPLLYWCIAGIYKVAGVSEFAARTPTAIAGVALVLSMYLLARKHAGERAARWGALALLASPYVLHRMRYAELDIPLTLATFLAIFFARSATLDESSAQRLRWCFASGVTFGAAIMLKGPVPFLFFWAGAVATFVTSSPRLGDVMRTGIKVSVGAFFIEIILKLIAARVFPSQEKLFDKPVALVLVILVWTYLALRYAGVNRTRLIYWFAAMVVGILIALPWGLAVLDQMGWANIRAMLNNQVVERVSQASRINSGAPWYFLLAIGPMLAPWGFLLPFQFSKLEWTRQNDFYRFCVLMAWLSVLTFSLIAGKEYEYILPCVPFMALAIGYHVAQIGSGQSAPWMEQWAKYWQIATLGLIGIALPCAVIYFAINQFSFALFFAIIPLALAGIAACIVPARARTHRSAGILIATLCAILMYLIARGDHFHGNETPKEIARLASRYANAGYTVESSRVYPSIGFYAGTVIPLEQNASKLREKFASPEPYIYLTRKSLLQQTGLTEYKILAGPIEFKDLILISNQNIPPPGEM